MIFCSHISSNLKVSFYIFTHILDIVKCVFFFVLFHLVDHTLFNIKLFIETVYFAFTVAESIMTMFNMNTVLPLETTRHPAGEELPAKKRGTTGGTIKIKSFNPYYPEPIERENPEKDDKNDHNGASCVALLVYSEVRRWVEVPLLLSVVPISFKKPCRI